MEQLNFDEFHSFIFSFDQLVETLKTSPVYDPFTKSSFFWTFLSIILSLSDYGSDIAVAVLLYGEEDTDWWFALTLTLILVPLTLVNIFSIFWHHQVRLLHTVFVQIYEFHKVNSLQEACAKCFGVHILKFEILYLNHMKKMKQRTSDF